MRLVGARPGIHRKLPVKEKKQFPQGSDKNNVCIQKLDDGWPESEKGVFQAALMMVVVKDSR